MSLAGTMVEASLVLSLVRAVNLTATTCDRSFRPILLIPSWEGPVPIPKRSADPAIDISTGSMEKSESA